MFGKIETKSNNRVLCSENSHSAPGSVPDFAVQVSSWESKGEELTPLVQSGCGVLDGVELRYQLNLDFDIYIYIYTYFNRT